MHLHLGFQTDLRLRQADQRHDLGDARHLPRPPEQKQAGTHSQRAAQPVSQALVECVVLQRVAHVRARGQESPPELERVLRIEKDRGPVWTGQGHDLIAVVRCHQARTRLAGAAAPVVQPSFGIGDRFLR